jgi:hypothetical protein
MTAESHASPRETGNPPWVAAPQGHDRGEGVQWWGHRSGGCSTRPTAAIDVGRHLVAAGPLRQPERLADKLPDLLEAVTAPAAGLCEEHQLAGQEHRRGAPAARGDGAFGVGDGGRNVAGGPSTSAQRVTATQAPSPMTAATTAAHRDRQHQRGEDVACERRAAAHQRSDEQDGGPADGDPCQGSPQRVEEWREFGQHVAESVVEVATDLRGSQREPT